jgi:hypothetical protein
LPPSLPRCSSVCPAHLPHAALDPSSFNLPLSKAGHSFKKTLGAPPRYDSSNPFSLLQTLWLPPEHARSTTPNIYTNPNTSLKLSRTGETWLHLSRKRKIKSDRPQQEQHEGHYCRPCSAWRPRRADTRAASVRERRLQLMQQCLPILQGRK